MNMNRRLAAAVLATAVLLTSCNGRRNENPQTGGYKQSPTTQSQVYNYQQDKKAYNNTTDMAMEAAPSESKQVAVSGNNNAPSTAAPYNFVDPLANQDINASERKLTKNGNVSISVPDIKDFDKVIDGIAKKYNGYTFSVNQYSNNSSNQIDMTIKVSQDNFDNAMNDIKALGTVVSASYSVDDLTLQFVDTESRLNNLKVTEGRLLDLLKEASRVEDLITIENQLQTIRTEIEYTTSSLNVLKNQVQYSTLFVSVTDKKTVAQNPSENFIQRLIRNLREGVSYWLRSFGNLTEGIVFGLPVLIPIGLILWLMRRSRNRKLEEIRLRNERIAIRTQEIRKEDEDKDKEIKVEKKKDIKVEENKED